MDQTSANFQMHVEVGVHEVMHAMGFSSNIWKRQTVDTDKSYFLNSDASDYLRYDGVIQVPRSRTRVESYLWPAYACHKLAGMRILQATR
jgi:hypothetical protein